MSGLKLFFKVETFQKGGAFKFRGALNSVLSVTDEEAKKGFVTHSSGNHAAALALSARLRNSPAYIVVPENTPQVKLDAIMEYGGRILMCKPTLEARTEAAAKVQALTGATMVPPFNYGPVIAGQGTIALEFLHQVPDLDILVVPVSGGGMLAGIALAAKAIRPDIVVVAAEPSGTFAPAPAATATATAATAAAAAAAADAGATTAPASDGAAASGAEAGFGAADVAASLAQQRLVSTMAAPATIADGLRAHMGELTWPIVRDHVDGCVPVSDREIIDAMKLIFQRMKLVVEPSGAVGLAAALSPDFFPYCKKFCAEPYKRAPRVGVVLCGGNLDLSALWGALEEQAAAQQQAKKS